MTHSPCLLSDPCDFCDCRTLPKKLWLHVSEEMVDWFLVVLLWPLVPLFIINVDFYCELFIKPFYTAARVKQTLLHTDAQQRP